MKKILTLLTAILLAGSMWGETQTFNLGNSSNATTSANIYLKNTMNWANAYVYFYNSAYWDASKGSGSNNIAGGPIAMTYDAATGLFTYDASSYTGKTYVVFSNAYQANYGNFYGGEFIYCDGNFQYNKVVVVEKHISAKKNNNQTTYYAGPNIQTPSYVSLSDAEGTLNLSITSTSEGSSSGSGSQGGQSTSTTMRRVRIRAVCVLAR